MIIYNLFNFYKHGVQQSQEWICSCLMALVGINMKAQWNWAWQKQKGDVNYEENVSTAKTPSMRL